MQGSARSLAWVMSFVVACSARGNDPPVPTDASTRTDTPAATDVPAATDPPAATEIDAYAGDAYNSWAYGFVFDKNTPNRTICHPATNDKGLTVAAYVLFGQLASADIGALGHSLAIAVVATMYGAIVANAICGPIGDKLALRSSEEIQNREMMLQAILSIQAGDNPRVTLDKMTAFVPASARSKLNLAA